MTYREYRTLVEYFMEGQPKQTKKIAQFTPTDPVKTMKAIWYARLGIKEPVT